MIKFMCTIALCLLLFNGNAKADVEPWQKVLVLTTVESFSELFDNCEFKATVVAKGKLSKLIKKIAKEALLAEANVVQLVGGSKTGTAFASSAVTGTVHGRAFYCQKLREDKDITNSSEKIK